MFKPLIAPAKPPRPDFATWHKTNCPATAGNCCCMGHGRRDDASPCRSNAWRHCCPPEWSHGGTRNVTCQTAYDEGYDNVGYSHHHTVRRHNTAEGDTCTHQPVTQ